MFFHSTSGPKGGFQKFAGVPNIHLGLHYSHDVRNFATTFNATTMMGEQKHKIFKLHAPHTNSKGTDLQLLKSVNTTQTIRFLLDGTFDHSSPMIAGKIKRIVESCDTLRTRFLGRGLAEEVGHQNAFNDAANTTRCTGICTIGSAFSNAKTGLKLANKHINVKERESDTANISDIYKTQYNVTLKTNSSMGFKLHYWSYFSGEVRDSNKPIEGQRKFKVKVGGFVRLHNKERDFYRLERCCTLTVGTMIRAFLVLRMLERDLTEELSVAPYQVVKLTDTIIVTGINNVDPTLLHFVSKDNNSWWFNPFVPYFM